MGPGVGGCGKRVLRPGLSGRTPHRHTWQKGGPPTAYLGRGVLRGVWARHSSEGPVGLLHVGGQCVGRGWGWGLGWGSM